MRLNGAPDLLTTHNNGTLFVRPNPEGRLAHLVRLNNDGKEMGWIFGSLWENAEIDAPIRFGVIVAKYDDWHDFRQLMIGRGITFGEGGDFVPFSNGTEYVVAPPHTTATYMESEMRLVRKDFVAFFAHVLTDTLFNGA